MLLPELVGARDVTPADAAEAVAAAVRFELELLGAAVERAEQEAEALERLVASVSDVPGDDDRMVHRLSQFLDQHAAEAADRRRATLDEARAEADLRLELARDEAQLILLGGPLAPAVDAVTAPPPQLDYRAVEFPIDSTIDLLRELVETSGEPMPHLSSVLSEPPADGAVTGAEPALETVPCDEPADSDERFQSFWDGQPTAESEREPWWSFIPFDTLVPMVALVLLLAVVLVLVG